MAYQIKNYTYNHNLSAEENLLLDRLFKLRMSGMAEALEHQFMNPNSGLENFETRLTDIINHEWELRQTKKFNKLLRQATLKYPDADLDNSIYEPDRMLDTHTIERLMECGWIDEGRNLLITGSSGAGKTYLANALCIAAMHQMRSVRYIRATALLQECETAENNGEYLEYSKKMMSYDLLVIDDFGLMNLSFDKCRHFFEIVEARDHLKSTAILSQLPVSKWWDLFTDNTYADACLGRMTSKAYRLECNGRDMRKE